MQNPNGMGGPRPRRPARGGFWPRGYGMKPYHGGRKAWGPGNYNPRWTPMPSGWTPMPCRPQREVNGEPSIPRHNHRQGIPKSGSSNESTGTNTPVPEKGKVNSPANPNLGLTRMRTPPNKVMQSSSIPEILLKASLPTFDLQAQDVIQQCLISPERRKRVNTVVSDVRNLLRSIIPDNNPIVYGSMATGLAFETSDIDCFIDSQMIPDGQERAKVLLKNFRVFYKRGAFKEVVRIPSARVPLVKAVHSKTGIEIDMSCTSKAALNNTRLIRRLADTDVRIRRLIVLVSLCYRLNGISGTQRFVSYTIVLLVFFYLQNLETPMLPPLHRVVHPVDDSASGVQYREHDDLDVQRHLRTPNSSNLTELFSGFFKFYDSFDFGKNVVSTYMGQAIPVECFAFPEKLPEPLSSLKQYYNDDPSRNKFLNKFVCVQDPLEHYINTTSYVQLKTLNHFKLVNSYMVNMMQQSAETMWLEKMMKMKDEIDVSELKKKKNLKPSPVVEFNVSYPNESLSQDEWVSSLKKDLMAVFQLLLFDVVEVTKEPETKVRISEGPVHNRNFMTFELVSFFNVFTKKFNGLVMGVIKNPRAFKTGCDQVLKISERIKKPPSSFHCELTLKQPISPEDIPVTVRDMNEKSANTYLHISTMLKKHLTELLAAARKSEKPTEELVPVLVPVTKRPNLKFTISYGKGESEEEEDWKNRLKIDLISLFEFLLLKHQELPAECSIIKTDDDHILAFELESPYNIFIKRFSESYTRVLEDPSSLPTVMAENELTRSNFNATCSPTFHCELVLARSEFLPPHQLFVILCDVNDDVSNNFPHFSSMLLLNFGSLLNSIKTYRESQRVADPEDNKGDSEVK